MYDCIVNVYPSESVSEYVGECVKECFFACECVGVSECVSVLSVRVRVYWCVIVWMCRCLWYECVD